jgi:alpha,alpha-trehalase
MLIVVVLLLTLLALDIEASCPSPVFCTGTALDAIQKLKLYDDDKEFVDRVLTKGTDEFIRLFSEIKVQDYSNKDLMQKFVKSNTQNSGSDLIQIEPTDFNPNPKIFTKIPQELIPFVTDLHSRWKNLLRAQKPDLMYSSSSLLPVPNPFIVPGGRFREWYNWDSFWILSGLQVSEMNETALHIIQNFLWCINEYGFVPNGGRIYYLNRSQPPLTAVMIWNYYQKFYQNADEGSQKVGLEFLRTSLPTLLKEYSYWMSSKHMVLYMDRNGNHHKVNRYNVDNTQPRPESYMKDYDLAQKSFQTENERKNFYAQVAAGAESGIDYSTRWFDDYKKLTTIKTNQILPIDLNSLMYRMEYTISLIARELRQNDVYTQFNKASNDRKSAIYNIFWNSKYSTWFDVDMTTRTQRIATPAGDQLKMVASIYPVWAGASHLSKLEDNALVTKFVRENLRIGGISTTNIQSDQQWDDANVWAPLQYFISQALENSYHAQPTPENQPELFKVVNTWISTTYCGWKSEKDMFEKYDANRLGKSGGGGEYLPQGGFGWTNGLVLTYLDKYSQFIQLSKC